MAEVVGASDPCVSAVPALISSSSSTTPSSTSLEALAAVVEKYQSFGDSNGIVRCRRGLLRVRVQSRPSLEARLGPPLPLSGAGSGGEGDGGAPLRVLTLHNRTSSPMRLIGSSDDGDGGEDEGEGEWIRPSSVRFTLAAHSSRNLLVSGEGHEAERSFRWSIGQGTAARRGVVRCEVEQTAAVTPAKIEV